MTKQLIFNDHLTTMENPDQIRTGFFILSNNVDGMSTLVGVLDSKRFLETIVDGISSLVGITIQYNLTKKHTRPIWANIRTKFLLFWMSIPDRL